MRIGDILAARNGETIAAHIDENVGTAAALLAEKRIGAMPVLSGGLLVKARLDTIEAEAEALRTYIQSA